MAPTGAVTPEGDIPLPGHHVTAAPQVRVRVIKGRQLRGKDINPVVKVLIGKQNFRTRSRSGNNPYLNGVTPGRGRGDGRCPSACPHRLWPGF